VERSTIRTPTVAVSIRDRFNPSPSFLVRLPCGCSTEQYLLLLECARSLSPNTGVTTSTIAVLLSTSVRYNSRMRLIRGLGLRCWICSKSFKELKLELAVHIDYVSAGNAGLRVAFVAFNWGSFKANIPATFRVSRISDHPSSSTPSQRENVPSEECRFCTCFSACFF